MPQVVVGFDSFSPADTSSWGRTEWGVFLRCVGPVVGVPVLEEVVTMLGGSVPTNPVESTDSSLASLIDTILELAPTMILPVLCFALKATVHSRSLEEKLKRKKKKCKMIELVHRAREGNVSLAPHQHTDKHVAPAPVLAPVPLSGGPAPAPTSYAAAAGGNAVGIRNGRNEQSVSSQPSVPGDPSNASIPTPRPKVPPAQAVKFSELDITRTLKRSGSSKDPEMGERAVTFMRKTVASKNSVPVLHVRTLLRRGGGEPVKQVPARVYSNTFYSTLENPLRAEGFCALSFRCHLSKCREHWESLCMSMQDLCAECFNSRDFSTALIGKKLGTSSLWTFLVVYVLNPESAQMDEASSFVEFSSSPPPPSGSSVPGEGSPLVGQVEVAERVEGEGENVAVVEITGDRGDEAPIPAGAPIAEPAMVETGPEKEREGGGSEEVVAGGCQEENGSESQEESTPGAAATEGPSGRVGSLRKPSQGGSKERTGGSSSRGTATSSTGPLLRSSTHTRS